jgi:hypothetical protein
MGKMCSTRANENGHGSSHLIQPFSFGIFHRKLPVRVEDALSENAR